MCRNIKTLFNFAPPATDTEIHDASLQFVRKLSGFTIPSKANEAAFERARRFFSAATVSAIRVSPSTPAHGGSRHPARCFHQQRQRLFLCTSLKGLL